MDPTGQLRGGPDPWTPPASYAAALKAHVAPRQYCTTPLNVNAVSAVIP